MKRFSTRSLTTLALFGIILAASSAHAAENIEFLDPTNNATVTVGPGNTRMKVKFKTNNGFNPLQASLRLSGGTATLDSEFSFDGITAEYTAEFSITTSGTYSNSSVKILAKKDADSGGNPIQYDTLEVTGITVTKQQ